MKLTIAKEQITLGLQTVQNVVSTRTTLPILSNVLLHAREGRLEMMATDLDVTVCCSVEARVEVPGWITIPVKKLLEIVRELPTTELELEVGDRNFVSIQAGGCFFRIHGLPAEEYPPKPKLEQARVIKCPQEKLRTMMRRTCYAVSTDESRYVLNGLFLSLKDHKFTIVATDGRRLALTHEEIEMEAGQEGEFIVPTKAVNELVHLVGQNGDVEISFTANQVSFQLAGDRGQEVSITSKLVEGSYPNYRQVIPAESAERIPLVREELLHALRRAEIMTSDKSNSVKLSFTRNNLAITANTPDFGEARESVAVNYKGRDVAIAFNPTYLMDPLKVLDVDEVFFELTDELSPGVLKINGPFLYVIMPMRMS